MGRLIPAGTGLGRYRRTQIEVHDEGEQWEPLTAPRRSILTDEEVEEELAGFGGTRRTGGVAGGEDEDAAVTAGSRKAMAVDAEEPYFDADDE